MDIQRMDEKHILDTVVHFKLRVNSSISLFQHKSVFLRLAPGVNPIKEMLSLKSLN